MKHFNVPALDGLRAVAFLLVFVAHYGLGRVIPGGFGVTVFFFLSGYLITTILRLEEQRTGDISLRYFYLRRALRIFPPMYITLAVGYLIGAAHLLPKAGDFRGFLTASTYTYNYAELLSSRVNLPSGMGVVWSLMVEEHFYLLFPLFYRVLVRKGMPRATQAYWLLGICGVVLLWRFVLVYGFHTPLAAYPRWTYSASDSRFDSILFGCILAIWTNPWTDDRAPLLNRHKGVFALLGLGVIAASLLIRDEHFREALRYSVQSAALYPIFYYCIAAQSDWRVRWLSWKPLRWIGWLSYSMYLGHEMLRWVAVHYFPNHALAYAPVCFAVVLGYALLMRVWVEEPIRRLRRRMEDSAHKHRRIPPSEEKAVAAA